MKDVSPFLESHPFIEYGMFYAEAGFLALLAAYSGLLMVWDAAPKAGTLLKWIIPILFGGLFAAMCIKTPLIALTTFQLKTLFIPIISLAFGFLLNRTLNRENPKRSTVWMILTYVLTIVGVVVLNIFLYLLMLAVLLWGVDAKGNLNLFVLLLSLAAVFVLSWVMVNYGEKLRHGKKN
ncbi:MAG: hypothetical protein K1X56_12475 [Flavobacteriales bacterium]|nr:hypothetical protein [Flavobacteriales bacterium]